MKQIIDFRAKEEQLPLFPVETKKSSTESASFSDPAFASNKTFPIHRWVPWIAGFSSDFVRQALEKHLDSKGTVLDPFAGVGTTLIESIRMGHNAIGFEINPYAALACRIKLNARLVNVVSLRTEMSKCNEFYIRK